MVDPETDLDLYKKVWRQEYTDADRYREFRAVFLRDDQSRRVLWEILSKCKVYKQSAVFDNQNRSYFNEGQRAVGLWVLATLSAEPAEAPTHTETMRENK